MKKIFLLSALMASIFLNSLSVSAADNQKGFMAPNMGSYHNMKKPMSEADRN